jgi:hypothetical protein
MSLTSTQVELITRLRSAVANEQSRRVIDCTECLGYLPFGLYHWFTLSGKNIGPDGLPWEFSRGDLDALEAAGFLSKVDQWTDPEDDMETNATYEVSVGQSRE